MGGETLRHKTGVLLRFNEKEDQQEWSDDEGILWLRSDLDFNTDEDFKIYTPPKKWYEEDFEPNTILCRFSDNNALWSSPRVLTEYRPKDAYLFRTLTSCYKYCKRVTKTEILAMAELAPEVEYE